LVDILYEGRFISLERYNYFAFTNPFDRYEFLALYARSKPDMIRFDSLAAGIELSVFLYLSALCCVLVCLYQLVVFGEQGSWMDRASQGSTLPSPIGELLTRNCRLHNHT
jgi:hypothetical protein